MPKLKAVPDSGSRASPVFWDAMIDASFKRREKILRDFEEFSRWHRGNLSGVVDPKAAVEGYRWQYGISNMASLATTASMADLLFRYPRLIVRSPYASASPTHHPALSKCETGWVRHALDRTNFLVKARRSMQDGLLGGIGILKITADTEVVVDEEALEIARVEAQSELDAFLLSASEPKAKDGQLHSVHINVWRNFLGLAERENSLTRKALKYIRAHIRHHEAMKDSERPTEVSRTSEICVRRINPLDYAWDPTVDDRDDATWRACQFLMRKADVLTNNDYDKDARDQVQASTDRWVDRSHQPSVQTPGSFDIPEDMVMVKEVFDVVDQKRRLYADGCTLVLLEEDRLLLADVQPSGPFHEIVFIEDSLEAHGVSPVSLFAGEQAAATHIASAMIAGAVESRPRTLINKRDLPTDQAALIQDSKAGSIVMLDPKGDPSKKIADMFGQMPPVEIPVQNMTIRDTMIHGIERISGLGVAKLGGGEQSPTATGAALGADASNAISEDRGALIDHWLERCGRTIVRLTRLFVPKSKIVAVCGVEAIEAWPEPWAVEDVRDDIGVTIIPGSSRRHNTNLDQKQILDGITAFSSDPQMTALTSAGKLKVQMYQMFFEDSGITGLDWKAVEDELAAQAMMQQMMMQSGLGGTGGPGGPQDAAGGAGGDPQGQGGPEPSGAPGNAPGPSNSSPRSAGAPQANDLEQGVANVGGGRVATGASVGDKIRFMRGGAKQRIASRG